MNSVKAAAREKFGGVCRVCRICNGVACAGELPGMGGVGTGAAFQNNLTALTECRLNLRTIHNVREPSLVCRILGQELALPVLSAPLGGLNLNMNKAMSEPEYVSAVFAGSRKAGSLGMSGDGPLPESFAAGITALAAGAGIPVIKPREKRKVVEMANQAAAAGAPAFGMDIDAAALFNMVQAGQPVGPKTSEDLCYIQQHTDIPFIVKGIMTPDEAEICLQAGVAAIVVSNHGGRALDHTPGTAAVLPYIAEKVAGQMAVLVDGGIRTGTDVLKMLALGADAVLIGRPVTIGAIGGGAAGVTLVLRQIAEELRAAMVLTGVADVTDVPPEILW